MHCKACDALLTEKESTKKDPINGDYLDLCTECYLESAEAVWIATGELTDARKNAKMNT